MVMYVPDDTVILIEVIRNLTKALRLANMDNKDNCKKTINIDERPRLTNTKQRHLAETNIMTWSKCKVVR